MIDIDKEIENDLSWRETELAVFREILSRSGADNIRSSALFRAGWALIYAHYEGFCKFILELYLDCISNSTKYCKLLPEPLLILSIESEIRKCKSLSSRELYNFFKNDLEAITESPPKFNGVDTKSNLWPDLLEEILDSLDIPHKDVLTHRRKLITLVARRNDIAHGKKVFINDIAYYLEYETAALNAMYALALVTSERYHTLNS